MNDAGADATATDLAGRPWQTVARESLAPAAHVFTMLHPEERKLYFWLTAHYAKSVGAVVDLGAYLGGSTAYLAAGQRAAGHAVDIDAFDRFDIRDGTRKSRILERGVPPFEGSDTRPAVRALLAPFGGTIRLHAGDLTRQRWTGAPVEILTVDAAKHARTADHIALEFFPTLIPGKSLVVHQDCLNNRQPWICAQMGLFAEFFEPLVLCHRETVVYRCIAPISPEDALARQVMRLSERVYVRKVRQATRRLREIASAPQRKRILRSAEAHPQILNAHDLGRALNRSQDDTVQEP